MIKYQESEVKDVKIEATSSIGDLVRKLRSILSVPGLNWKCENKNMLLEYDGVEVEDWNKRVVDFSRCSPFFLGKYACMHACLNGSTQYWLCRFQVIFRRRQVELCTIDGSCFNICCSTHNLHVDNKRLQQTPRLLWNTNVQPQRREGW